MPEFDRSIWNGLRKRRAIFGFGLIALAAAIALPVYTALLSAEPNEPQKPAAAVSVDDLMKPGELPDITLGPADAKVTVVEYASMTCSHCGHFANTVFPALKAKYIDTRKIRFVFREFPLDNPAVAASMLARCAGGDKTFPLIETLFAKQADWAFIDGDPRQKLFELAEPAGFTKQTFDACLADDKLLKQIVDGRKRANEMFGVNATPSLFINGKRFEDEASLENIVKVIDPLL